MIEGLSGLIAIGIVATVGFMMVRSFNARRSGAGSSHDGSSGYWFGSDIAGPSATSSRDTDRDSSGWFGGLFSASEGSSSSHDSGSSSDSGGSSSDGGGGSSDSGGGGDGGGGGGGD